MAEYSAPEADDFSPAEALAELLKLLDQIFLEIDNHREFLFPRRFDSRAQFLAFGEARRQVSELVEVIFDFVTADDSRNQLIEYGLQGEPLRFKLEVVAFANKQIPPARNRTLERLSDGRAPRSWPYRKAVKNTLAAIDGPLESLTKMLQIGEPVVEFKKALEVLLDISN